jgi:hypothetical protein
MAWNRALRLAAVWIALLGGSLAPPANAQSLQDTLQPPSFEDCGTVLQSWRSPFGFVFGNNSLGDREKLQRLALPEIGNGFVTAVRVDYERLHLGTPSGSMRCVAYAVGPDGAPGAFLKASDTLTLGSLPSEPGEAWFSFPEPAAFTDAVYVGIDLRLLLPGDSIGVPGTEDGCGSGCWPYETWSDGTRNPICDTYDLDDVDFALAASVDWTPRISGMSTIDVQPVPFRAFPNPATARISIELKEGIWDRSAAPLQYQAIALDARSMHEGWLQPAADGIHAGERVDVRSWPRTCYLLRVRTAGDAAEWSSATRVCLH